MDRLAALHEHEEHLEITGYGLQDLYHSIDIFMSTNIMARQQALHAARCTPQRALALQD